MSGDYCIDADATPPRGAPIPSPEPEPARDRPHPHVTPPAAKDAEWERIRAEDLLVDEAIRLARALRRICGTPSRMANDATWPYVRDGLLNAERVLAMRPDEESGAKLAIVRKLKRGQKA